MAKKELTESDILKKQYSNIVKLNQRLKSISEGYYISHDGVVYVKSLVGFVEKVIHLDPSLEIDRYAGSMILPNQFFEFTKNAKKTKLTILETEKGYHFGQDDTDELKYFMNCVNENKETDSDYVKANIIPKMYKRFFELNNDEYTLFDDRDEFHPFTEEEVNAIASAEPVYLDFNETHLVLTKHLLLDVKKSDNLFISRYGYQIIEDDKYRVFYMLKQQTELYDCYTLFNTFQSKMI